MPVAEKVGRKGAKRKAPAKKKAARVSVRAFARELGVSHTAVQKGIKSGRLKESLGKDGRGVFIADVELGRREWEAGAAQAHSKGESGSSRLIDAQHQVALERVRKLKLETDQKAGKLIDAGKARREAFNAARTVRDNVLNVPDRVAAELAGESDPARLHARLQDELEKALETIAGLLEKAAGAAA